MTLICQSKRLNVRQFTLDDAPFIVGLLNDASFIRYIADKKVRTEQDATEFLRHGPLASYQAHGFGLNLVERREDGEPIGMCGVLKRDELECPDLGYAFLSRYTEQGYATEAAEAVLEATLLASGLTTVQAVTLPDNQPSNRLLEKLGFRLQSQIMLYGHRNNLYQYTRV
ncbi:GNAT family N-acetyltransferase [Salinivibrio kushneri]|uniref:GNAT family N-acetyltransferase n=1 Tax=Salinivibrio kushneri TaxID=1908198 RepID=UPI000986AE83|nr:GNAT family N-acetyltransferase [Salinivibrio kushneri]OOE47607.1 GNAT family N-acetyltransferase [Salinivibrio kushneri]OOE51419.1 GNAT family N-acetyltransferase [Salinivibrio kushneri]OOE61276.1 GNAT family N-acetyltransferase [Salinivibrio kushneri]